MPYIFGINILYGRVMHGNNVSVRVLEKNGYEFAKEEFMRNPIENRIYTQKEMRRGKLLQGLFIIWGGAHDSMTVKWVCEGSCR